MCDNPLVNIIAESLGKSGRHGDQKLPGARPREQEMGSCILQCLYEQAGHSTDHKHAVSNSQSTSLRTYSTGSASSLNLAPSAMYCKEQPEVKAQSLIEQLDLFKK